VDVDVAVAVAVAPAEMQQPSTVPQVLLQVYRKASPPAKSQLEIVVVIVADAVAVVPVEVHKAGRLLLAPLTAESEGTLFRVVEVIEAVGEAAHFILQARSQVILVVVL
jgi:hypothetical protein